MSIGVVTWQSAGDIEACLAAVRQLSWADVELLVLDNGSTDGTVARLGQLTTPAERVLLPGNIGFAAGHNRLIARASGEFYLALNPDVVLDTGFLEPLVQTMGEAPWVGAATGKLLRVDVPATIDSTGIVMLPSQRHLDRGADRPDAGQYERRELVFGASGAAAFYRRAMLEDTRLDGEYFDEDFFVYREDADLAWRAQLLGWACAYVPAARARHRRHVTPERRAALAADINRASVRNRFLLRIKNQSLAHALAFAGPTVWRDLQVVGYVLLREWSSMGGLVDVLRLGPRMWRKRQIIFARRRARCGKQPGNPGRAATATAGFLPLAPPEREVVDWFRRPSRPWPA